MLDCMYLHIKGTMKSHGIISKIPKVNMADRMDISLKSCEKTRNLSVLAWMGTRYGYRKTFIVAMYSTSGNIYSEGKKKEVNG